MMLVTVLLLLLALPASAHAAAGTPDRDFGRRGTVTLERRPRTRTRSATR